MRADILRIEFFKLKDGDKVGRLTEPALDAPPFKDDEAMNDWCKSALKNRHSPNSEDWPDAVRILQFGNEMHRWTEWDRLAEQNNVRIIKMDVESLIKTVRNLRNEIREQLEGIAAGKYILRPAPPLSKEDLHAAMEATVEDLTATLKRYGAE